MNKPVTVERIEELKALGYTMEDMGEEFGADWEGQYRWFHDATEQFQDHDTSLSEAEAWADADRHAKATTP